MNIKDIVESYGIDLRKVGRNLYLGFCPFHNDRNTPNLYVYEKTNSFICYSCKKAGDPLKFISEIEHIERAELQKRLALDLLKQKLGYIRTDDRDAQNDFREETLYLAAQLCYKFLIKNPHKLDDVMQILEKFDEKTNSVQMLNYQESCALVEKFKNYLYNI